MEIKSLRDDLVNYLKKHGLVKKYVKQIKLFCQDYRHPSLHTESLQPKSLKIYSFRLDRKYRAIFILTKPNEIEIIDINDHYR